MHVCMYICMCISSFVYGSIYKNDEAVINKYMHQ